MGNQRIQLFKHTLGELLDVTRGMSLPGSNYATSGKLIRLTLGNFDYGGNGFKENTSKDNIYYSGIVPEAFILNAGDIITPLTEQTPGLLGTTARIPQSGKYIQSQDVALITCKPDKLDPLFCYYLVSSSIVKQQLAAGSQQTKIRHTSPDKIKACIVYIPEDLTIQHQIGELLTDIDEKIFLNCKANAELEALAKQYYDYWFVQFDFPDKNGRPYKSSGGEMVYDSVLKREIPSGWKSVMLTDIANITMGQSPDGKSYNTKGKGTVFFQGSTDFGEFAPEVRMYTTSPSRMAKAGDILMSVRAPVGTLNLSSTDCCVGRGLAALNSKIGSTTYLYYVLQYAKSYFDKLNSSGTTFGAITKDDLHGVKTIMPDSTVLNKFESLCSKMMEERFKLFNENLKLAELKNFVLPLLMNGQASIS